NLPRWARRRAPGPGVPGRGAGCRAPGPAGFPCRSCVCPGIRRGRVWNAGRGSSVRGARADAAASRRLIQRGTDPPPQPRALARVAAQPVPGPQCLLHSRKGEGEDRLLIAIDSDSAAARAALMTALPYLHAGVDVLAPADLDLPELAGSAWQRSRTTAPTELLDAGATRCVITL